MAVGIHHFGQPTRLVQGLIDNIRDAVIVEIKAIVITSIVIIEPQQGKYAVAGETVAVFSFLLVPIIPAK
jgi:hypothetical protein